MRIMLSCGEPSGDLYAGALVAELLAREPSAEVSGFGGQRLAAAGARLIGDFEGLSVTGLTEAIRVLPRSFAMLRRLTAAARELRPDVFVAIDFPDFNFRLMAKVHALGIPVVYYISPQLWAWRAGRMQTMKRFVTRVLVIFPFEEPLYRNAGVPVEFVGHPLVDLVQVRQPRAELLRERGLDPAVPTVALLPGSRPNELRRIVPGMAAALPLIRARVPSVQFLVAAAPNLPDTLFAPLLDAGAGAVRRPALVRERTVDVLAASDVVDTYAMANLVAGRRIVPELILEDFTAERVATETVRFLTDGELHARTREELRRVRARLGDRGASGRAADAVLAVARTHNLRR